MKIEEVKVDWSFSGKPNLAVGTGATKVEQILVWIASFGAAFVFIPLWYLNVWDWLWWQYLVVGCFAFDIVGGTVANTTNSCKRFYHTPSSPDDSALVRFLKKGLTFDLLHAHTIVLALIVPNASTKNGIIWYGALIVSVIAVKVLPLYLRPASFFLILTALILHQYFLQLGIGLEWVIPLLFIKIVYGHSVREEPYRPLELVSSESHA